MDDRFRLPAGTVLYLPRKGCLIRQHSWDHGFNRYATQWSRQGEQVG